MVGILEAQVEKLKPDIKKNVLRKILWVFLEMIVHLCRKDKQHK
jgi:hypothetical protein